VGRGEGYFIRLEYLKNIPFLANMNRRTEITVAKRRKIELVRFSVDTDLIFLLIKTTANAFNLLKALFLCYN